LLRIDYIDIAGYEAGTTAIEEHTKIDLDEHDIRAYLASGKYILIVL